MEQRQWIDIEIQESKDPCCFQVSKFITRLLRHSQQVNREEDAEVYYDQVIDECNEKQSDDTGYRSGEMKKDFVNAPHWSIENGFQFWHKVEDKRKGFNIVRIRTILINSCTFEQFKDVQVVQSIHNCKTIYCYQKV